VTIQRQPFEHLLYHFVLTYSNWETGTICFSESFESLSEGLQNALWELGGVPESTVRIDSPQRSRSRISRRSLRNATGRCWITMVCRETRLRPESPNENGDVEQRHYRLKKALEQSLMLRGSCDFSSRQDYAGFLGKLFVQLNAGRLDRFKEESGAETFASQAP
jgi:hypothetical protein